ncbi:hypothetical protein GW916_01950 [bacterium]|nr:hypothetical protein [bacterium]
MIKPTKQNVHTKDELKALKALDSENKKVVGSMQVRQLETDESEKFIADQRKILKQVSKEKDPVKLRALRRGK